ncbi:MAG: two-component system OmpR family phosphate regulon sensor histidine kinase PhoR [Syntrophaceae bacterium]|nr:MAG: two-component system OmpR family phosphate regulon sensor histidine kinase PhoR [Syntrophaceae bacterium]
MKGKLFFKILFSYLAIIFLSFLILNSFIKDEIRDVLTGKIERELFAYARLIDLNIPSETSAQLTQVALISRARVTLVDRQGKVLADSLLDASGLENHLNRPEVQEARVRGEGRATSLSTSDRAGMLYVAVAVRDSSDIIGYVRLARSLDDVKKTVDEVYASFLMALILTSTLSLILALIFSFYITKPVRILEKFTEKLRRGEPSGTLILQTSDETKILADNINYLVEELQSQIRLANEEKSKLMAAFTSMTEGVLIVDASDQIEFVSAVLQGILLEPYGGIEGKTLMEAFRNVELHKAFHRFKLTREVVSAEIVLDSIEPVIMNVSISGVHGYPGEEKTMVVFHDVTRLKKLERIRTDFVANVTHEIRTPLTAIIGYLETLQEGALQNTEDAKRFIEILLKQAQRLNRLVEDLMIISRIELGEVKFLFEDVYLPDIIGGVIPLLEAKAAVKNIRIENHVPEKMLPVRGDRDRLSQVFVNVLDNAVKFTPGGGSVTINAEEKAGNMVVAITDTGMGIPREEIQRLGERFYRVDKTRSRDLGGTGLGLSIVKHLMLSHGGRMEIESQLGHGTKVSLFFPIGKA